MVRLCAAPRPTPAFHPARTTATRTPRGARGIRDRADALLARLAYPAGHPPRHRPARCAGHRFGRRPQHAPAPRVARETQPRPSHFRLLLHGGRDGNLRHRLPLPAGEARRGGKRSARHRRSLPRTSGSGQRGDQGPEEHPRRPNQQPLHRAGSRLGHWRELVAGPQPGSRLRIPRACRTRRGRRPATRGLPIPGRIEGHHHLAQSQRFPRPHGQDGRGPGGAPDRALHPAQRTARAGLRGPQTPAGQLRLRLPRRPSRRNRRDQWRDRPRRPNPDQRHGTSRWRATQRRDRSRGRANPRRFRKQQLQCFGRGDETGPAARHGHFVRRASPRNFPRGGNHPREGRPDCRDHGRGRTDHHDRAPCHAPGHLRGPSLRAALERHRGIGRGPDPHPVARLPRHLRHRKKRRARHFRRRFLGGSAHLDRRNVRSAPHRGIAHDRSARPRRADRRG